MNLDPEFVEAQREKALHKWRWRNPYLAAFLALLHPVGMLYTSVPVFVVYTAAWFAMFFFWRRRPLGTGIALGSLFGLYAYFETRWRNAAVEKWRYGLPGTGSDNPRKLGLKLIGPDASMSAFSARVYWFEWRVLKMLPSDYVHKVASLLHVKIPVTPPALAGMLLMQAGGIGVKLLNTPEIKEELSPLSEKKECDLLGELLRAFYCLAVAILGNDEFASSPTEYNLYTAATYERLREIMAEHKEATRTVSEKMMDEARLFYLNDKPSLAEYAETMQDYRLGQELERALKKGDWFSKFIMKLNIRVAAALGITKHNYLPYLTLTIKLSHQLIAHAKSFGRLRPVIWDPTEPEMR